MADLKLHEERCPICKSNQRNEIDAQILRFEPIVDIARETGFSEHSVSNHAHVTGLVDQRLKDKRAILARLIEYGFKYLKREELKVAANDMIKSVEVLGKLDEDGRIVDRTENRHKIDFDDEVKKQIANLKRAIRLEPDEDIPE